MLERLSFLQQKKDLFTNCCIGINCTKQLLARKKWCFWIYISQINHKSHSVINLLLTTLLFLLTLLIYTLTLGLSTFIFFYLFISFSNYWNISWIILYLHLRPIILNYYEHILLIFFLGHLLTFYIDLLAIFVRQTCHENFIFLFRF